MAAIVVVSQRVSMDSNKRTSMPGIVGMAGALVFFIALIIEYRYGLFPPGGGALFAANQIMFIVAMTGLFVLLLGMRMDKVGGDGWPARLILTFFPLGWLALILASSISLIDGSGDNLLYPIGGLSNLLFGLLTGIVVLRAGRWQGWTRFAPLLQATYYLVIMFGLTPILTGSIEPTFLTESLWMVTWFLMGVALYKNGAARVVPEIA
jgi:hypothetical protein